MSQNGSPEDLFKQALEDGTGFMKSIFGDGDSVNVLSAAGEKLEDAKQMVTDAVGDLQIVAQEYAFPVMMHVQKMQRQAEDLQTEFQPVADEIKAKVEPVVTGLVAGLTALVASIMSDPDQELRDMQNQGDDAPEDEN